MNDKPMVTMAQFERHRERCATKGRWLTGLVMAAGLFLGGTLLASWSNARERLSASEATQELLNDRLDRIELKLDRLLER